MNDVISVGKMPGTNVGCVVFYKRSWSVLTKLKNYCSWGGLEGLPRRIYASMRDVSIGTELL